MVDLWRKYFMFAVLLLKSLYVERHTIWRILLSLSVLQLSSVMSAKADELDEADVLSPYRQHHGPLNRTHRDTQACQSVRYGNVTHTKYLASSDSSLILPLVESHHMLKEIAGESWWEKREAYITHQVINNPLKTWSVLEPGHPGTCQNGSAERETVAVSAQQKQCLVATNAGFFDTHTGACLGNVVSEGFIIQDSEGIQNVHFGITKDGFIYTGYLSEMDLLIQDFTQLMGGVVWLVRDGESYVAESKSVECPDTEETGTIERFINVVSARTAVGHDAEGRIHMVQVNGKTSVRGVNLYEFADLLIELGLVNAINLDGGGSATLVINGTLANYPSDQCVNSTYNCPRKVSTILCVHEPSCSHSDCSGHGLCVMGVCQCEGYWTGEACEKLVCPDDCNSHGQCKKDGCQCHTGWRGENCSMTCQEGWYGLNCSLPCACENGALCDHQSGVCTCLPGFTGKYCEAVCTAGYYGQDCSEICFCDNSCYCDPVSGSCNVSTPNTDFFKVSKCLAQQQIKHLHLVPDKGEQYSLCVASAICLSIMATFSLLLNMVLTYMLVKTRQNHRKELKRQTRLAVKYAVQKLAAQSNNSENDDEDDDAVRRKISVRKSRSRFLKEGNGLAVGMPEGESYEMERREEEEEENTDSADQEEAALLSPERQSRGLL